jgi:hypothetical protein
MTDRLENALRQLTADEVERLTDLAEQLARGRNQVQARLGQPPKLTWIGCLENGPWKSGLEAQEGAKHYRIFLLERGMPK